MNESDKEYTRRVFAILTGVFEDASETALKGQSPQLTTEAAERIIRSLEKTLADSDNLLNSIKNRMER